MTSDPDSPSVEARLDLVHGQVLELQARVASLEAELRASARVAPS